MGIFNNEKDDILNIVNDMRTFADPMSLDSNNLSIYEIEFLKERYKIIFTDLCLKKIDLNEVFINNNISDIKDWLANYHNNDTNKVIKFDNTGQYFSAVSAVEFIKKHQPRKALHELLDIIEKKNNNKFNNVEKQILKGLFSLFFDVFS